MRKRLQFALLFLQVYLPKHKKQIIISGIIGFFITLLFFQSYPLLNEVQKNQFRRIGIIGTFNDSSLPIDIQRNISLGLTLLKEDGSSLPSLSTSWKVDEKGLVWTFYLRNDVVWHNGKKFTAADINYKLSGAEFIPINDSILTINLKEKYAPLPVVLSQPIFKSNLMGLGVYKVVKLQRIGEAITELLLEPQLKNLPTLSYKFFSNLDEAVLAFKLGEIDVLQDLTGVNDVATWNNINITQLTEYDKFVGLFFNLEKSFFKDKEVRQALSYAIPRNFDQEKTQTPISPLSWAYSSKTRLYNYDTDSATKILSKSPLSSSSSQIIISTYANLLDTAQMVSEAWIKVGVNTKIKVESSFPSDYDVLLATQVIPSDPDQYQYWQSTQEGTNLTHYNNQKIDKLLEDGRKTFDINQRKKIYADFQRYLVDDSPVIFLYYPMVYTIERK